MFMSTPLGNWNSIWLNVWDGFALLAPIKVSELYIAR